MSADKFHVVVIGAGPGGTVCAAMLEQMGIEVAIVERGTFPRFTIGESLLPATLAHLEEAKLLEPVMNAGFVVKHGAVFDNGVHTSHLDFSKAWHSKASHAFNLQRADFDLLLANEVAARGVPFFWNSEMGSAQWNGSEWTLEITGPDGPWTLRCDFLVDSSGAGLLNKFADAQPAPTPSSLTSFGSVFCHLEDAKRPEGFEGGAIWINSNETKSWGWIIPFSDGTASVGFVGIAEHIRGSGETDEERFSNLMNSYRVPRERFRDAKTVRFQPHSVFNYRRPFAKPSGPGFCLVGNSLGFLDPVFSSGVAIATESALRAAKAIRAAMADPGFCWDTQYDEPLSAGLKVMSACVEAWYDGVLPDLIHRADDPNQQTSHFEQLVIALLSGGVWDQTNSLTSDTAWSLRYLQRRKSEGLKQSAE